MLELTAMLLGFSLLVTAVTMFLMSGTRGFICEDTCNPRLMEAVLLLILYGIIEMGSMHSKRLIRFTLFAVVSIHAIGFCYKQYRIRQLTAADDAQRAANTGRYALQSSAAPTRPSVPRWDTSTIAGLKAALKSRGMRVSGNLSALEARWAAAPAATLSSKRRVNRKKGTG